MKRGLYWTWRTTLQIKIPKYLDYLMMIVLEENSLANYTYSMYFQNLEKMDFFLSKVLGNFDDEVVNGTHCDPEWSIWLYDIFYKSKIQRHFTFKTKSNLLY